MDTMWTLTLMLCAVTASFALPAGIVGRRMVRTTSLQAPLRLMGSPRVLQQAPIARRRVVSMVPAPLQQQVQRQLVQAQPLLPQTVMAGPRPTVVVRGDSPDNMDGGYILAGGPRDIRGGGPGGVGQVLVSNGGDSFSSSDDESKTVFLRQSQPQPLISAPQAASTGMVSSVAASPALPVVRTRTVQMRPVPTRSVLVQPSSSVGAAAASVRGTRVQVMGGIQARVGGGISGSSISVVNASPNLQLTPVVNASPNLQLAPAAPQQLAPALLPVPGDVDMMPAPSGPVIMSDPDRPDMTFVDPMVQPQYVHASAQASAQGQGQAQQAGGQQVHHHHYYD